MNIDIIALTSFVLVTTFTPGPNNISSASMGILYGYRKTLRYLSGIVSGFFLVLLLTGWISKILISTFPSFESVLRIVGAAYILWLAWHTFKASYTFNEKDQLLFGFSKGFFLQLVNPKAIVYGMTLYGTFLGQADLAPILLILSAFIFSCVGFAAVSSWTLFGAGFRKFLNQPKAKQALNIALSLLLAYTALEISGLFDIIF